MVPGVKRDAEATGVYRQLRPAADASDQRADLDFSRPELGIEIRLVFDPYVTRSVQNNRVYDGSPSKAAQRTAVAASAPMMVSRWTMNSAVISMRSPVDGLGLRYCVFTQDPSAACSAMNHSPNRAVQSR
jgi:hypothetical protein